MAEHRRLPEIVDDDANELHGVADHRRLGCARVEDAAGDRLRQRLGRHRVVFAVVDDAKPRPKQQSDEPLRRDGQRSNDAVGTIAGMHHVLVILQPQLPLPF